MIRNAQNLDLAFKGFKTLFNEGWERAPTYWEKLAMVVKSQTREENYGWLGQAPEMREWSSGEAYGYGITNKKYESTIGISRDDFDDDKYGLFANNFRRMGEMAKRHPDTPIFPLLQAGTSTLCYDGQNFFDMDHPYGGVWDGETYSGAVGSVSNYNDGTGPEGTDTPGPAWYLMDTSMTFKPIVWQERNSFEFQAVNRPDDHEVFMTDEYKYGVRARHNVGFGLWELAYCSKAPLTSANYRDARSAMQDFRGDENQLIGVNRTSWSCRPSSRRRRASCSPPTRSKAGSRTRGRARRSSSCRRSCRDGARRHLPGAGGRASRQGAGRGAPPARRRHPRPRRSEISPGRCRGRRQGVDARPRPGHRLRAPE